MKTRWELENELRKEFKIPVAVFEIKDGEIRCQTYRSIEFPPIENIANYIVHREKIKRGLKFNIYYYKSDYIPEDATEPIDTFYYWMCNISGNLEEVKESLKKCREVFDYLNSGEFFDEYDRLLQEYVRNPRFCEFINNKEYKKMKRLEDFY